MSKSPCSGVYLRLDCISVMEYMNGNPANRPMWLLAGLLVSVLAAVATAGGIETRILQYRLDRIYMAAGRELLVFPGYQYTVMRGPVPVYGGTIEQVDLGICYSYPTGHFFDTIAVDSCYAIVEVADVDSQATIQLKSFNIAPSLLLTSSVGNLVQTADAQSILRATTESGNRVTLELITDMPSFHQIGADGWLSYEAPRLTHGFDRVESVEAPFLAVLLPNLARKVNESGLITTSLYYRFDEHKLHHLFDGNQLAACLSLYGSDTLGIRSYAYDPQRGSDLLKNLPHRLKKLHISYMDLALDRLGWYFADVLSRDRIKTEVTRAEPDADILLVFCPVSREDPVLGMHILHSTLSLMGPRSRSQREALQHVANLLEFARSAPSEALCLHYCDQADRILKEDLGVFPLFQPRIHMMASPYLRNIRFHANGCLDLLSLEKLRPPIGLSETQP